MLVSGLAGLVAAAEGSAEEVMEELSCAVRGTVIFPGVSNNVQIT